MTLFVAERDKNLIATLANDLGVVIPEGAYAALVDFAALVALWNRKSNLVGCRSAAALVDVLFGDALMLAKDGIIPRGAIFADVGAGAGAPALPLAILRPDVKAVLVEPRRRRVAFMRTAIGSLRLAKRATVLEGRLEDVSVPETGWDFAYSRATFAPDEWLPKGCEIARRVGVLSTERLQTQVPLITEVAYELQTSGTRRWLGVFVEAGAGAPSTVEG